MPADSTAEGCLYVVATPIGNLEDITLRALKTLASVDIIAAEDTRHTRRLLSAHGITKRLVSYHEHNEARRCTELMSKLAKGVSIALVTNAGTPCVSDPGYRLVQAAAAKGISIVPIPGVSAAITALSAAGLATDRFTFIGFPSRKKAKRMEQLKSLATSHHTLIFYQSPHRLTAFVKELIEAMGDRPAVLARELTKVHEEFMRCPLSKLAAQLEKRNKIRGECTLLVSGTSAVQSHRADLQAVLKEELAASHRSVSQVAKDVARRFDLPRKVVYDHALKIKGKRD